MIALESRLDRFSFSKCSCIILFNVFITSRPFIIGLDDFVVKGSTKTRMLCVKSAPLLCIASRITDCTKFIKAIINDGKGCGLLYAV